MVISTFPPVKKSIFSFSIKLSAAFLESEFVPSSTIKSAAETSVSSNIFPASKPETKAPIII